MRPIYYIQIEDKNVDKSTNISTLAGLKDNFAKNLKTIVFTNHAEDIKEKYSSTGINTIIYDSKKFEITNFNSIVKTIYDILQKQKDYLVVFEDNNLGNSIASRLAAKLNIIFVPHITSIKESLNSFTVIRNIENTKAIRETPIKNSAIISLSFNGVFDEAQQAKVKIINWNNLLKDTKVYIPNTDTNNDLSYAKVIVAGGKGLQDMNGFKPLKELAKKLNASVAATKAVTDQGWINADKMIGISNLTVSPDVYYAFGISGAVQHTVGMNKSKHIIAINTDKTAPIFKLAEYGIIGDANKIIDNLINLL